VEVEVEEQPDYDDFEVVENNDEDEDVEGLFLIILVKFLVLKNKK
jgi:hypothetical protein